MTDKPVVAYCAVCKSDRPLPVSQPDFGRYFLCSQCARTEPDRLARVILDDARAKWWLRAEWQLLRYQNHGSPVALLENRFGTSTGVALLIWMMSLALAICTWSGGRSGGVLDALRGALWVFAIVLFVDAILSNLSITFTSRYPANPIRTVLLTFLTYVNIGLASAVFYLALASSTTKHFEKPMDWASAVFFSFGTLTTVGYGDRVPQTACARLTVILELLSGLFFISIIVAQVAGWASQSKREEPPLIEGEPSQ